MPPTYGPYSGPHDIGHASELGAIWSVILLENLPGGGGETWAHWTSPIGVEYPPADDGTSPGVNPEVDGTGSLHVTASKTGGSSVTIDAFACPYGTTVPPGPDEPDTELVHFGGPGNDWTLPASGPPGDLGLNGYELYFRITWSGGSSGQMTFTLDATPAVPEDEGGDVELLLSIEPPVDGIRIQTTAPSGVSAVTITRTGPSGTVGVRGWVPHAVDPETIVIARDFEAPIGSELTYRVTFDDGSWGEATIEIPDQGCSDTWLTDLVRPSNTRRVIIESLPELAYDIPATVHRILRRRDPIVSSDIANTPTFTLSVLTETLFERDQVRATLGNGVPVLLRTSPQDGIGNLYFVVLSFQEQRVVTLGTNPLRRFQISAQQIARPDPALFVPLAPVTYAWVAEHFSSYADVAANRDSYDALAYDYAAGIAGDLVPWPPDDI